MLNFRKPKSHLHNLVDRPSIHNEEIGHESWFSEFLGAGPLRASQERFHLPHPGVKRRIAVEGGRHKLQLLRAPRS